MPICTFMSRHEERQSSSNTEIAALVKEVTEASGRLWIVTDHLIDVTPWWSRKKRTKTLHTLYVQLVGAEYQMINFYSETAESSINTIVSADLIVAYLYGMLGAIDQITRTQREREANEQKSVGQ